MGAITDYFKIVLRHRKYVAHYCFMCHEYKRGIFHDMSSLSRIEFSEMAAYYDGKHSTVDICRRANGYSEAWLHHKGKNDHHYEYWTDDFDRGGKAIRMPYHPTVEMLCDYIGSEKANNPKTFTYQKMLDIWNDKTDPSHEMMMHEDTQEFITVVINALAELEKKFQKYNNCNTMLPDGWVKKEILNEKQLKKLYDAISGHNTDIIENIAEEMAKL